MANEHQFHGTGGGEMAGFATQGFHISHGMQALPSVLTAPPVLKAWRFRALVAFVVLGAISILAFSWTQEGREHLMRSWLMGSMTCFNFVGGALALLMVQYLSGGKWGLILRRPLEAMTRTWWVVVAMFLPVLANVTIFSKGSMYQWAIYTNPQETYNAWKQGLITQEQQLCMNLKHTMLSPTSAVIQFCIVFGFMGLVIILLNKWSIARDADPAAGTLRSFDRWRITFENLAGPCTLLYVIAMTDFVIVWLKSLDVTWYSSVYGLQLLVAQGYAVLALGVLTLCLLSKYEPMRTMFRITEQHDIGKLMFAFVMLNIYLTFAEFLIIWSGNVPDELPWYLHRIYGGWWVICTLDVICHWVIPFCILLSRDFKRSRSRMIWLCLWMLFARLLDMFWLIEPNFKNAAGNLHITGNFGILAYITMPLTLIAAWLWFYIGQLTKRPLIVVNDPHTEEVLEAEHVH